MGGPANHGLAAEQRVQPARTPQYLEMIRARVWNR
jgi:hypothetical protein